MFKLKLFKLGEITESVSFGIVVRVCIRTFCFPFNILSVINKFSLIDCKSRLNFFSRIMLQLAFNSSNLIFASPSLKIKLFIFFISKELKRVPLIVFALKFVSFIIISVLSFIGTSRLFFPSESSILSA